MKKILVIEDEPEMRRNLTTILRLERFNPWLPPTAEPASSWLKEKCPTSFFVT
jgi:DNA-binding NtrC family response regulator